MWLIIKNGKESDRKMINVDNVAFMEPLMSSMGTPEEKSCIVFSATDECDISVNVPFDQLVKVISDHIRSEIITIT